MPTCARAGAVIDWQADGPEDAPPLVMVHGAWSDRSDFAALVPRLTDRFRVVTWDRRGHGASTETGTGTAADDVADLAAVIEAQGAGPAFLFGHSFGAVIALKLAATRPELIARLAVFEPPIVRHLDPAGPIMARVRATEEAVVGAALAGDGAAAARLFIDGMVYGPGTFDRLPARAQAMMAANARTFLGEMADPDGNALDLAALARFDRPTLIVRGALSPEMFQLCADIVEAALPRARRVRMAGASHSPHATHPGEVAALLAGFFAD